MCGRRQRRSPTPGRRDSCDEYLRAMVAGGVNRAGQAVTRAIRQAHRFVEVAAA
jgi:hypothetical protein